MIQEQACLVCGDIPESSIQSCLGVLVMEVKQLVVKQLALTLWGREFLSCDVVHSVFVFFTFFFVFKIFGGHKSFLWGH